MSSSTITAPSADPRGGARPGGRDRAPLTGAGAESIDLDIQGMTCASCAARIEKKLNKLEGVSASVNYATEKAHVMAPRGTAPQDLIAVVEKAGYAASIPQPEAEPVDHAAQLARRLLVATILGVPVIVLSMLPVLQFRGWQWLCLALATPVVVWCGLPFHRSALVNARHRATTMDTLVSLGTLAAYLWSLYALVFGTAGHLGLKHEFSLRPMRMDPTSAVYFEAACGVTVFLLLGRWIEARSRRQAGSALTALLHSGVREVAIVTEGVDRVVPVDRLAVGDVFRVAPGQKVATDGEVAEGTSAVDASLVTGESLPVEVHPGDAVVGGSLNTSAPLLVRATAVGADTQLARIAHLVEAAQTGKANAQRLADKVSSIFVPVVLTLSLLTLVAWLVAGRGWAFALSSAIAVLIIACPCALGLATPTALLAGTGRGAELGILIGGPEALERAQRISTVLLDKTGTLTTGRMTMTTVVPLPGTDADQLAQVLRELESGSQHPVARAVLAALPASGPASSVGVHDVAEVAGRGVRGLLSDGSVALAGSLRLMRDEGIDCAPAQDALTRVDAAASPLLVAWDGRVRGFAVVADTARPDAHEALRRLRALGLRLVMVSGDTQGAAEAVAAQFVDADGSPLLAEVRGGVLPEEKAEEVTSRQRVGERVAMVGDGINDAAALAAADLGIAMGEGTDAARAASDITLLQPDLALAADAIRLSRRTLNTIHANLFWATAYNTAAIPLAATGMLTPMIAGAAMAFSSVFVVLNSLRLRTFRRQA